MTSPLVKSHVDLAGPHIEKAKKPSPSSCIMVLKYIFWLWMAATAVVAKEEADKPNFIVILTDDQDQQLDSMKYMPKVKKLLTDEGVYFNHHYATVALCCPARASLWTGKAAHNTNVTNLRPPYGEITASTGHLIAISLISIGGYPKFVEEGWISKWLPVYMQKSGYKTYFTGKLMNNHNANNYMNGLKEMGLDGHDFMIEPGEIVSFKSSTITYWNRNLSIHQHDDSTQL
ncbi:unnamed protein product [Aspergillus oryzae]|uniref:Unnamed protein product n=1 Tax=Aspergillus oryzae TaxID=5062 RepID=A0AAN5BWT7_ASPOZ|nr:unnamed protein product [Aspergillus oryzae]